jgi:hypothetical protein
MAFESLNEYSENVDYTHCLCAPLPQGLQKSKLLSIKRTPKEGQSISPNSVQALKLHVHRGMTQHSQRCPNLSTERVCNDALKIARRNII